MSSGPARLDDLLAHADWLRRLAVHVARGRDAEDALQDTWLAALRSPPDAGRPAQPWLAEVLRNFVRRRARTERSRAAVDPAQELTAPSPEVLLESAEAQRILAELVVALPEPYRATVMLRYYEGLSSAAIAAAQGVPPGTVRWRLKEGLSRLRTGLDARYAGDRRAWCLALFPRVERGRLLPVPGALLMTTKTKLGLFGALGALLLLLCGAAVWRFSRPGGDAPGPSLSAQDGLVGATGAPSSWPVPGPLSPELAEGAFGSIEGVVRAPGGGGVAGALVALVRAVADEPGEDGPRPFATARSGPEGTFRFGRVGPGVYLLTATASAWTPAEQADVALLPGASVRGVELVMGEGGASLSGVVADAGGGALPGAAVRALALAAGARPQGARTFVAEADAEGRYELRLPRGTFRVLADAQGYASESAVLYLGLGQRRDFRLVPAARVGGRVVHQGIPVAGARVRVESRAVAGGLTRATISDLSGTFSFADLPPGTYEVAASRGPLVGRARQAITVVRGSAPEVSIELASGAAVAGVVRDQAGHPLAGARVRAEADLASASSDREGRFRLEGLPRGRHRVSAEVAGFGGASTRVAVQASDVDGVELTLAAEARVHGRVLDRDGRPLADASVLVTEDLPNEATTNFGVARTDALGRYLVAGLGPGELRVEVEHREAGRGVAGPVPVAPGTDHEVDVRVGTGGRFVRGTVRWEDGEPAAGVTVRGAVRRRRSLRTVADSRGRYELGPFLPADVNVNAWPETEALGGSPGTAKTVSMSGSDDREGVDLVIPRRDETIAGVVLAPDGSPLAGVAVGVAPDHQGVSFRPFNKYAIAFDGGNYSALSDASGAFTVRFLPKGKYTVWATHPEFPEADAYDVHTGTSDVRVRFARGGALSGRAQDPSGNPIPAFTVYASLSEENDATPQLQRTRGYVQQWSAVEDAAGAFELSGLHAAIYDLLVVAPDRRVGQRKAIALAPGQTARDLIVTIADGARLRGRLVHAQNGKPASGLWVNVSLAVLHEQITARTDEQGSFVLDGIPPGKFVLHLPGEPRTLSAQKLPVEVPAGVREHDLGTILLARRPPGR
jgi:RNA polymerase sigma factor (sigma-70 family)